MERPFKNVITDRTVAFDRYIVLAEYDSEEAAKSNLSNDIEDFKRKYGNTSWYKQAYPFAWATIKE